MAKTTAIRSRAKRMRKFIKTRAKRLPRLVRKG